MPPKRPEDATIIGYPPPTALKPSSDNPLNLAYPQ